MGRFSVISRTMFVSYWETVPGRTMPPYVAMALGWSQHLLGNTFHLLTAFNVVEAIGSAHLHKDWRFGPLEFDSSSDTLSVVAKSDYIRLAYVLEHGGVWLDADMILFTHLSPTIFPLVLDDRLHWYSEALFGAKAGHKLLRLAVRNCLESTFHDWGNPGAIRSAIASHDDAVLHIPQHHFDPGCEPVYRFKTCDIMLSQTVTAECFLKNPDLKVLKLYNTYFSRSAMSNMSIEEFLDSNYLLAKVFLYLMPDRAFWRALGNGVMELVR